MNTKKKLPKVVSLDIVYKTQELLDISLNRYKLVLQVANRAYVKRSDYFDNLNDLKIKPVIKAIIEMHEQVSLFYSKKESE